MEDEDRLVEGEERLVEGEERLVEGEQRLVEGGAAKESCTSHQFTPYTN